MWWYNIRGYKKGSMPHLLKLDPVTVGYILLTANLFALKRVNYEPILTLKRIEWRKFLDTRNPPGIKYNTKPKCGPINGSLQYWDKPKCEHARPFLYFPWAHDLDIPSLA